MNTANKVLIVDDDSDILDFLIDILQDDITVSFAPNGAKALEFAKTQKPDLILLDVDMPELNGFEVCQQLKYNPETQNIPIIFLTALDKKQDLKEGLRLGAVDYITKPFDPEVVIAKVKNQLSHITALRVSEQEETTAAPGVADQRAAPVAPPAKSRISSVFTMALIVLVVIAGSIFLDLDDMFESQEAPMTQKTPATTATTTPPAAPAVNDAKAWPFNSRCEQSPIVSWWGTTTHFSMVDYVQRKHDGNWAPYMDKWVNQMNKMQSVYDRAGSAKVSDGTVLRGERLLEHVDKLKKRISVINCLAMESKTAQ